MSLPMAQSATTPPEEQDVASAKPSRLPLILGVVLGLAGAGGGFAVVQMGLLGAGTAASETETAEPPAPLPPIAFVPLDPLIVSLPAASRSRHLRFSAQLEVDPAHLAEVEALKPRIVDILNGYLRAVALEDLEDPAALGRLRAQMLRRAQIVTGDGRVRDLLIMEFVLN